MNKLHTVTSKVTGVDVEVVKDRRRYLRQMVKFLPANTGHSYFAELFARHYDED
jgi:predicted ABC-type exoprotein transport system permease subunit